MADLTRSPADSEPARTPSSAPEVPRDGGTLDSGTDSIAGKTQRLLRGLELWTLGYGALFVVTYFLRPRFNVAPVSTVDTVVAPTAVWIWFVAMIICLGRHAKWWWSVGFSVLLGVALFFVGPMYILGAIAFGAVAILSASVLLIAALVTIVRGHWRAPVALAVATATSFLAAAAFIAIPSAHARAVAVVTLTGIAGAAAAVLVGNALWDAAHRTFRKALVLVVALVLILEALVAVGLNAYADSKVSQATSLIQNDYAQIASAAMLGSAVASGDAPSGTSFNSVSRVAGHTVQQLARLNPPSQLLDYRKEVQAWGEDVEYVAGVAATGGTWAISTWPAKFTLHMSSGEMASAEVTSYQEIGNIIEFGNYALATRNSSAMLLVGGRLAAQSYWLEGVSNSTGMSVVSSHLNFIEPVEFRTRVGDARSSTEALLSSYEISHLPLPPLQTMTCPLTERCFNPPRGPFNQQWGAFDQLQQLRAAAMSVGGGPCQNFGQTGPCYSAAQQWDSAEQQLIPLVACSGGSDLGSCDPVFPTQLAGGLRDCGSYVLDGFEAAGGGACTKALTPQPLQSFQVQCPLGDIARQYSGGLGSNVPRGLGTNEGGWWCSPAKPSSTPNACWSYLTASGIEYQGGPAGCPQLNVDPPAGGLIGQAFQQVGDGFSAAFPPPVTITTTPPSTPTTPPPSTPNSTPTSEPANLPSGFPSNLPSGTYTLSICETSIGCFGGQSFQASSTDIATFADELQRALSQACATYGGACTPHYSAFNGSTFTVTLTTPDICSGGQCQAGPQVVMRVTRVG